MLIRKLHAIELQTLRDLFAAPPHSISLSNERSIAFTRHGFPYGGGSVIKKVYTAKFGERCCLVYERSWELSEREALEVLVDTTGDGQFINHFYYAAPADLYEANLALAMFAFENMHPLVE